MTGALARLGRRWLYIGHRWIGIVTCLFCAMWFVSGVAMMYAPYPRLLDAQRLAMLEPVDLGEVSLAPAALGLTEWPASLRLATLRGEPVWRIADGPRRRTVSARDGRTIGPIDAAAAREIAHAPDAVVETLERDQWTVAQGFNAHRPLHRVDLADAMGTEAYVSSQNGEIVQVTTSSQRFWNWVGSVPHWLYPTVLRQFPETWRQVVLWTSGPAMIGAIAGVWIGVLRVRMSRRFSGGRMTPYGGWTKWHHVTGLVGGVFVVTWLFSGWLSVNPFGWFDRAGFSREALRAYAGQPDVGAFDLAALTRIDAPDTREMKLSFVGGRAIVVAVSGDGAERVFDGASGAPAPLSDEEIATAAARLSPAPATTSRLTEDDAYWYSHHVARRLPVLRIKFEDAEGTWVHIAPQTGEMLGRSTSSSRLYRWLFNALHDFDLRLLLRNRPAWDVVMWALSAIGFVVSLSGVVIGWRRLRRVA